MELKYLQVVVMNNGEIICEGKTVGFKDKLDKYLYPKEPVKIEILGGVLSEVTGLPEGFTYELMDHDNEQA